MSKYIICVYAICKNEEKFVDRWMDSMGEADLIVVTDTGSTDNTVEKLKKRGAVVYVDEIKPWRFDVARNKSLDHVPTDVDICICTDLDEILEAGWRKKLESVWQSDTKRGKYLYNWSLKEDGTPDIQFEYSKLHSRSDYQWHYPVHEWLNYLGTQPENTVHIDGMVLNHYPDASKSRGSYLPLLEMAVRESPEDDRVAYYLGREYMFLGMWEACISTLKLHLSLRSSIWNEERCASMRWIAASYHKLSKTQDAYNWYYRAIAEASFMREPFVEFGRMAYELSDWPTVFYMMEEALKIKEKSSTYVNMGYTWDSTPDDLCAIACYWLGMYERAQFHAKAALAFSPSDVRLINNLKLIESKRNSRVSE